MMVVFSLFALPLLFRLLQLRQAYRHTEGILLGIITLLGLASLGLATLGCARIFATAFGRPDIPLLTVFIALPLAWVAAVQLFRINP